MKKYLLPCILFFANSEVFSIIAFLMITIMFIGSILNEAHDKGVTL